MMAGCKNRTRTACLLVAVFLSLSVFSQTQEQDEQRVHRVIVEHADSSLVPKDLGFNVQILMGNVVFRHDSAYMYCDSARLNNIDNRLEAFGHVVMKQGDTLSIFSDRLTYDANQRLACLREHVRMENGEVTLITDSFNYDRELNFGYYFDGGMLLDSLNELTSTYGQYSPDTKMAVFEENVILVNSNFTLTTDSLEYNTDTKMAYLVSLTEIRSDSGRVVSDRGWYNTETEYSVLYDRSLVLSADSTKSITADSLHYNRSLGWTEAFGQMLLTDSARKIVVMGNYGYYDDTNGRALATDSAQIIDYSQGDSLYLHADTLLLATFVKRVPTIIPQTDVAIQTDSLQIFDNIPTDSLMLPSEPLIALEPAADTIYTETQEKEILAYRGVRFYRTDFQGVCDSMRYTTADSILSMYRNPVLWNSGYQIFGDTIHILMADSAIRQMTVKDFAFAVEEIDTLHHNQLKGKVMTGLFENGEIYLLDVKGNAETVYYPVDEKNGSFIGLLRTSGSFITFFIENRKPVRIKFTDETDMKLLPLPDLTPKDKFLDEYRNLNYLRPRQPADIFMKTEMRSEDRHEPQRTRGSRRGVI